MKMTVSTTRPTTSSNHRIVFSLVVSFLSDLMSRAAEGTEDKGDSVKEVLDDNVCNAEEIVAHSKLTASPMSLLQLMYKLGLSLVLRTSIMSLLNWLLTISTSSTASTLIDPEAVLLNTESMRETL